MVAANGLCVVHVGIGFLNDLDLLDRALSALSRLEVLRDCFLSETDSPLLCSEKRFVDDTGAGGHVVVSYKKGMIGCCLKIWGQKADVFKALLSHVKPRKYYEQNAEARLLQRLVLPVHTHTTSFFTRHRPNVDDPL